MLVLVVGPSGAGKDTLLAAAREILPPERFRFVRREITRPADAGGEDHLAVDAATFAARRASGAYALSWEAHGLGYGIPADISGDLAVGRVVVANVSRGAIAEAASRYPAMVLEITASPETLARRLASRGRETASDIAARLARTAALPEGVEVVRVFNDAGVEAAAAAVAAALTRAMESAQPA